MKVTFKYLSEFERLAKNLKKKYKSFKDDYDTFEHWKSLYSDNSKVLFKRHFFEHMDTPNDSCYEVALLIVA